MIRRPRQFWVVVAVVLVAIERSSAATAAHAPLSRHQGRIRGLQALRDHRHSKGKKNDEYGDDYIENSVNIPTYAPISEAPALASTKRPSISPTRHPSARWPTAIPTEEPKRSDSKGDSTPGPTEERRNPAHTVDPEEDDVDSELEPSPAPEPSTSTNTNTPSPTSLTDQPAASGEIPVIPTSSPEGTMEVPSDATSSAPTDAAPSTAGMLTPTELAQEAARSWGLLPFSIVLNGPLVVDDVDQVMEVYLFNRMSQPFETLESILLTVTSDDDDQRRERRLAEQRTFNFTGVAVFVTPENLPTQKRVHEEQLKALRDFHVLNIFVGEQDLVWEIDEIILDGITIDKDGMTIGGGNEIDNDGDTVVRGDIPLAEDGTNAVAISLSSAGVIVFLLLFLCFALRRRRRQKRTENLEEGESVEGLMKGPEEDNDARGATTTQNMSFDPTLADSTFDSTLLHTTDYRAPTTPGPPLDWNRVFALSQTPVEDTVADVFEPKRLSPPKEHTTHEIVTLASVTENRGEHVSMPGFQDNEDLYGYDPGLQRDDDSFGYPMQGMDDNLDVSAIGFHEKSLDYDTEQDRDITMDLDDFHNSSKSTQR